jgi:hypothetical protein
MRKRTGRAATPPIITYVAKAGCHLSDEDAQRVGTVIGELTTTMGKVTPKAVLEVARDPSSVLHRYFEWDDTRAAEAHRLGQATYLLRSIEVSYSGKPEERARAFHIIRSEGTRGYVPLQMILTDQDMTEQLVRRAKDEQVSWARRYQALRHAAQLSGIFVALESAGIVDT